MQIIQSTGLLLLSTLLLFLAWPPFYFGPLIFIGLVPIFIYLDKISSEKKPLRYILGFIGFYLPLSLFSCFASLNAWGDVNTSVLIGVFVNFFPLSLVLGFSVLIPKKVFRTLFILFGWGSMELFQQYWQLNAPLFLLGNGLGKFPSLIQHYAIWGGIGGSIYIVWINMMIAKGVLIFKSKAFQKKHWFWIAGSLLPLIFSISVFLGSSSETAKNEIAAKVGILLPNFDQYQKEYAQNPYLLIDRYNNLFEELNQQDVDLVVLPETAVLNSGWVENLNAHNGANPLDSLLPGKEIVLGTYLFSISKNGGADAPYYVRHDSVNKIYYETHNCAVYRNNMNQYAIRSKGKFIPFHDAMPYSSILMFTENWINQVGVRTYISKYSGNETDVFSTQSGIRIYTLLCFESFFSNLIVQENKNDLILVLANEIWNDNERGRQQYIDYLVPRAIESGKPILKVSNGGYSVFIDSYGNTSAKLDPSQSQFHVISISKSKNSSFYSKISGTWHILVILLTITPLFSLFFKRT
ncbi:MAG: apolipoprotein N-acyltransferase [Crocinitomicaceae bacterium]|nr:apolipoprotein N-acyltransferase [Crocinitomicaceae bacterium]